MSAFDDLLQRVRICHLCAEHLPLGPRPVLQAHPLARLLIAGQAPGRKVHLTGVPFDDPSGERLRHWMGVTRDTFYDPRRIAILPMGFCYPGAGRSGDLPPRPECAPAWRANLLAAMPRIRLTLVIGQHAFAHHCPTETRTLTDVVQDWRHQTGAMVVLPHPSPRNNPWLKKHPWFESDLVPHLRQQVAAALG
ncbi:MAG: uracil-DNA glycosylase family protein [Hydrogenophaga sp.]|nr:uracil-DNA glycosylase family protein [Hydrogenophaga sp.]